jgi:hypothetical protein
MLHSGSRGIGNKIGTYFIAEAKHELEKRGEILPDNDLAYLSEGTESFSDYITAMTWAQDYAATNRELMLKRSLSVLREERLGLPTFTVDKEVINCFAGETLILTRNGSFPINELVNKNVEILTTGGEWVIAPIKSYGKQRLIKINVSRCGKIKSIYATAEHGWIIAPIQRSFTIEKKTSELKPGDRLAYCFPKRKNELQLDNEGICRGFVFGDGSISLKSNSKALFCGGKDANLMTFFNKLSFGKLPKIYNKVTIITGLPKPWKREYPELNSDENYLYSWLAGYFAADGDVDKSGRPTLASSKRENLEFVRKLCTQLGIGTFGIRERFRKGFGKEPTALYLLGIMRNDLDESFFIIPNHKKRFIKCGKISERKSWYVTSIEQTNRVEEVFCAEVDVTHAFTLEDNILTRNCHHNYVTKELHFGEEVFVTRKGAVRAGKGDMGIIPGSMGARSFIVRGLGNPDSYMSCSHGAGRVMSRTKAKKQFTVEDLIKQTNGVECRKDAGVIDEAPQAYKDIDAVMAAQSELVEIVHEIKQVLCVKG